MSFLWYDQYETLHIRSVEDMGSSSGRSEVHSRLHRPFVPFSTPPFLDGCAEGNLRFKQTMLETASGSTDGLVLGRKQGLFAFSRSAAGSVASSFSLSPSPKSSTDSRFSFLDISSVSEESSKTFVRLIALSLLLRLQTDSTRRTQPISSSLPLHYFQITLADQPNRYHIGYAQVPIDAHIPILPIEHLPGFNAHGRHSGDYLFSKDKDGLGELRAGQEADESLVLDRSWGRRDGKVLRDVAIQGTFSVSSPLDLGKELRTRETE